MQQKELATTFGLTFEDIKFYEDYADLLYDRLTSTRKTTYIMVPEEFEEMIIDTLDNY
jgi:hypothetical protein